MAKYRNRNHLLLFWTDNEKHMEAYEKLTKTYDYVSILHDRDISADGEIKKPHIHAFVSFKNARWSTAISEDIGLELNYFEEPKNSKNTLLYLLHYNDPDKAQYDLQETKGPLKARLATILKNEGRSEGEKVAELIEFIESYNGKIYIKDFAKYCAMNGYWSEFRRSGSIFCKIIEEHNFKYQEKTEKD